MRMSARQTLAVVLLALASAGCTRVAPTRAVGPAAWSPTPGIATTIMLTCGANGSASVSDDSVQAQPDGIHLRVVNEYDEPVSVGGFDASPGTTKRTLPEAPGRFELGCRPFSQHGSGHKPPATAIEILDPSGLFFPGQVDCPDEFMSSVADFSETPAHYGPPPLNVARESIHGLRSDDIVRVAGYPDQDNAEVTVIRDGRVIASYRFIRFEGQPWIIEGGTACVGFGLSFDS